jgi:hypothetical protein
MLGWGDPVEPLFVGVNVPAARYSVGGASQDHPQMLSLVSAMRTALHHPVMSAL